MPQVKNIVKILATILFFCSNSIIAQTEFDIYNIYDVQIFKKDSIANANEIISIFEYNQSLNADKKLLTQKEFSRGYLTGYQRYFLDYPFIFKAKIFSQIKGTKFVEYSFFKSKYELDSSFFTSIFKEFIPKESYKSVEKISLKIRYTLKDDTIYCVRNYLNNKELGAEYNLSNFAAHIDKENETLKQFRKSLSKNDTIVIFDTSLVGNYRIINTYSRTIYSVPVVYDRTVFLGDSIIGKVREVRKFDDSSRLVLFAYYSTLEDTRNLKLNKSEKTHYHHDGSYTLYEDVFLADGKPDLVSEYNSSGALVSYKKYFSEGGFSEIKYIYDYRGLLMETSSYLDGKYLGKNIYTYSFGK